MLQLLRPLQIASRDTRKTVIPAGAIITFLFFLFLFRKCFVCFVCLVRLFARLFVRKFFEKIVRADAINLVQKSSNFEPSSRFFDRLKIFGFLGSWFIIKDMDPSIHGSAAGAAARAAAGAACAATVCTYYVVIGGAT